MSIKLCWFRYKYIMIEPTTYNNLQSQKYSVNIKRLPNISFFANRVSIPGVTATPAAIPTPFAAIKKPSDHLDFSDLTLDFLVSEDISNYKEIFSWLSGINFPESYSQSSEMKNEISPMSYKGFVSDISVLILSNSNNKIAEFLFKDAFPISLGELTLAYDSNEDVVSSVSFAYTNYEIR